MTAADPAPANASRLVDAAWLSLMLTELQLPTVRQLWQDFARRADAEG